MRVTDVEYDAYIRTALMTINATISHNENPGHIASWYAAIRQ
jgi:hypothetical protein